MAGKKTSFKKKVSSALKSLVKPKPSFDAFDDGWDDVDYPQWKNNQLSTIPEGSVIQQAIQNEISVHGPQLSQVVREAVREAVKEEMKTQVSQAVAEMSKATPPEAEAEVPEPPVAQPPQPPVARAPQRPIAAKETTTVPDTAPTTVPHLHLKPSPLSSPPASDLKAFSEPAPPSYPSGSDPKALKAAIAAIVSEISKAQVAGSKAARAERARKAAAMDMDPVLGLGPLFDVMSASEYSASPTLSATFA